MRILSSFTYSHNDFFFNYCYKSNQHDTNFSRMTMKVLLDCILVSTEIIKKFARRSLLQQAVQKKV